LAILAAQTHSSGAQQCDSMASHQQKLNAKQKKDLCQASEEGPKQEYKDLATIAEKKFGMIHVSISLSDSQITRMIKERQSV